MTEQRYSQTGEEQVLDELFAQVGEGGRFLVDLGAGDGRTLSNTRLYLDRGWRGVRVDLVDVPAEGVVGCRLTAENVCGLLEDHGVPDGFDLLSLDLDGNDWYVLRALFRGGFRPRVFLCEINGQLPEDPPATIVYNPAHAFDNCRYYGASFGAFRRLARHYGYTCVRLHRALNAFFVQRKLLPPGPEPVIPYAPNNSWGPDPKARPWHLITDAEIAA
jgi:hypothetical protein